MKAPRGALQSPAFRLLAACADWPAGRARELQVRNCVAALDGEWAAFLQLVERHRLAPLALDGLNAARIVPPPDLVVRALRDKRRALRIAAEGMRLVQRLEDAGIAAIVLKGPPVSQLIYGDPGMRQCADLDLLVAPADLAAARQVLGEQGYRLSVAEPPWGSWRMGWWALGAKDLTMTSGKRGVAVELHFRLDLAGVLQQGPGLADAGEELAFAGGRLQQFTVPDLFAYLCVHGATSLWNRLKWLADIRALLAGRDEAAILALHRHAAGLGVGRCSALALLMCQRVWGQPLPAEIAALRESDPRLALLEERALVALADPDARMSALGNRRLATSAFRLRDGMAYYRRLAASLLVDPGTVATLALPRALAWLYVPARLSSWLRNRRIGA